VSTRVSGRVLVAGVGNLFFGDDGFGPEVVRGFATEEVPADVRVVDYGIRGMHLAYDLLDGYDALVLVDAVPFAGSAGRPGELRVLEVGPDDLGEGVFDAHGMDPVSVLASLDTLGGRLPRTFVVGCQPADVTAGIGLSPAVRNAVGDAMTRVRQLLDDLLVPPAAAGADVVGAGPVT
jgi:hydrogenase maturation protease